jgi:adenosine kinase
MIGKKTEMSIDDLRRIIDILVITKGKEGSTIYLNGDVIEVPPVPVEAIKDPTGVGDAYRAGLLCGIAYGFPMKLAGEMGAMCAAFVLEQVGPQSHHFSIAEFIQRFRMHFDDGGLLDRLQDSAQ